MVSQADNMTILAVKGLDVYYGHVHVLQGVSFNLHQHGILGIVGRNGMGKTTLCNAIMGLVRSGGGGVWFDGQDISNMEPHRIVDLGVGYVPQGRRVWASLTVDEHLKVATRGKGTWSPDRVYQVFPRLAERRKNAGNQLSGGEQQMLAIGRALVANPRLLIMDEPTEGLAPRIVQQVEELLISLAESQDLSVLLVEQNLGVATRVAKRLAVMVNGRIETELDSATLAADRALQQKLLGVSADDDDLDNDMTAETEPPNETAYQGQTTPDRTISMGQSGPATRWSHGNPLAAREQEVKEKAGIPHQVTRWSTTANRVPATADRTRLELKPSPTVVKVPVLGGAAYVVGTFDTKEKELFFVTKILTGQGVRVTTVDVSTSEYSSPANITPKQVAVYHPEGTSAVFTGDRGSAVSAMAQAFGRFIPQQNDIKGVLALGGSGGTAIASPGLQALDVGVPKIMVSTVASGDVSPYVGASDICMLYSVTDVAGINRISEKVLSNAANALAGMLTGRIPGRISHKPAIGLTMFGLTTPCVQAVLAKLEHKYDCLVFHATGTGGRSMEKLVDSGVLEGVIDITTTEVTDLIGGGVFAATEDRMGAIIRAGMPYVGSVGAVDMINFGGKETLPPHMKERNLYIHNPQVTLVRTTAEEAGKVGEFIGRKLNQMTGPVRFFLPEKGLSGLSVEGGPFSDPAADQVLFDALERTVEQNSQRKLKRLPYDINHPMVADALVEAFNQVSR